MIQPQDPHQNPGYIDAQYLTKAAALMLPLKQRSYAIIDASEGSQVLDIGCGPGSDTVALGHIVGERGKVVGVDNDAEMIMLADQRAATEGVAGWVEHHTVDAAALPFADNSFDAVRAERVFQHLTAPETVLAEMVRVTRSGGVILLMDTDWSSVSLHAPGLDPELTWKLRRLLVDLRYNGFAGRQLYTLLKQQHLADVYADVVSVPMVDWNIVRMITRWDKLRTYAESGAGMSPEELDRVDAICSQAAAQGTFWSYACTILAAAHKP